MPAVAAKTANGRIILVQEQRFRLMTNVGRSLLLTLAHNAPVDALGLRRFRDELTPVVVEYTSWTMGCPSELAATAGRLAAAPARMASASVIGERAPPGYAAPARGMSPRRRDTRAVRRPRGTM